MASPSKKGATSKRNKRIVGIVAGLIILVGLVMIFVTPSAETVFKDMNEKMLETKSVTIDQTMILNDNDGSTSKASSKMYMDMKSSTDLLTKGNFSMNISNSSSPMTVSGDLTKVGDSIYVKYSEMSSTSSALESGFSQIESKLKGNWIKVRNSDKFASMAKSPLEFLSSVLPTPFANLDATQRKDVLTLLRDKSMYTIEESSKVDTLGVSAYKYLLKYNKDQYAKVVKAISGYVSYFKASKEKNSNEIKSLTVWVDINTKQIIKIEFEGTSSNGDVTGTFEFTGYNQNLAVEKPGDYFIESELLN